MDLGKLPTDNLYKFVAISGVTLAVVSFIWPIQISKEVSDKLDQLEQAFDSDMASVTDYLLVHEEATKSINRGLKERKLSVDFYGKEVLPPIATTSVENRQKWEDDLLEQSKEAKTDRRKLLDIKGPSKDILEKFGLTDENISTLTAEEQAKLGEQVADALDHRVTTLIKIRGEANTIWRLMDYEQHTKCLGKWGLGLGFGIAGFGFWLWWRRVQKLQDAILLAELEELKRNARDSSIH